MHFPKLPDWLIYLAVVLALIIAAVGRQENVDAPPPPPVSADEAAALSVDTAAAGHVTLPPDLSPSRLSTAFSIADKGAWLTAARGVTNCGRVIVMVSESRGVVAVVRRLPNDDLAVLITKGGAPALPLAQSAPTKAGEIIYHLGYAAGTAGEAASRYLGPKALGPEKRGAPELAVLTFAEVGRTEGLKGPLSSLRGAPAMDLSGRVVGVTLDVSPRRGRIYTSTPKSLAEALAIAKSVQDAAPSAAQAQAQAFAVGEPITVDNYGRMGDTLRRDMRVVRVACLVR
jgi:hypothetical protein